MLELLTPQDVDALNAARVVLHRIEKTAVDAMHAPADAQPCRPQDAGRLAAVADVAENACFYVLNIAASYCGVDLSKEQLHERVSRESYGV